LGMGGAGVVGSVGVGVTQCGVVWVGDCLSRGRGLSGVGLGLGGLWGVGVGCVGWG